MSAAPALLILADDLTGSTDAGVQFAQKGISSFVFIRPEISAFPKDTQVVVVNTESRHVPANVAAERVRRITEFGLQAGVRYFYKKTDSTLRGNIAVELETLMEVTRAQWMPFVPAFPRQGRVTRAGIHYVHGSPISETIFGKDPLNPVRESHVPTLLAQTAKWPVISVPIGAALPQNHEGVAVFDCETDEQMQLIGRRLAESGLRAFSGSADFVQHLPLLNLPSTRPRPQPLGSPILLVNGSLNNVSLEQIAHAPASFLRYKCSAPDLFSDRPLILPANTQHLLLHTVTARDELDAFKAATPKTTSSHEFHLAVARHTARHVKHLLATQKSRTLVVFGGDTLSAIAEEMNWPGLIPIQEILPGVSVTRPPQSPISIISKAGGFGEVRLVSRILDFFNQS